MGNTLDINKIFEIFLRYPIVCTDTRNIVENSLFFALKGDNFDANDFAVNAIESGCKYAIVDNPSIAVDDRFILVDDVLLTLQSLAKKYRQYLNIPTIGITGTNGKTTTKELINTVLSQKYNVHATKGNLNNHIGVPLTILSCPTNVDYILVEMGANHLGEIADLCEISQPNYGVITSIGKAHLEGFGSFENIIETKNALYKYVKNNGGIVFVNAEDALLMRLSENINRVVFGNEKKSDIENEVIRSVIKKYHTESIDTDITVSIKFEGIDINSNLFGSYNCFNIATACSVGAFFDVPIDEIKLAIENYFPTNNRSQIMKTLKNTLVIDAYNANPTSMSLAIESFSKINSDNKMIIIGGMRELGEFSDVEHKKIVEELEKLHLDNVILIGKEFNALSKEYKYFENVEEVVKYLSTKDISWKCILLKGSRGIQLEKLLPLL
ncbi:UDP-N-acetylmuramoyl-tripeptide--D-alanyl-D-alanine ligase [Bacteroidia bacterium]|nr:UDP-N-acetylmuramoyl-tripeptide--D-alanyl-D-alanine ligase [Bacteroidia bacterium]